jgi:misacylated tRNA(Ala) deacylase
MTVKLFWKDMYMREFDSKVERTEGDRIILYETAFYPRGGGAPSDTGVLRINGMDYKVISVSKDNGTIFHQTEGIVDAKPGDPVHGLIDWERRYVLMRYHTALHLLDAIVEHRYPNCTITGGEIFTDRARMDLDMPEFNRDIAQKLVDETNSVAQEGHNVFAKEISRDEALQMPNLARTEPGRQMMMGMDTVRLIEIEGVDVQMDGGTHVKNTKDIGKLSLSAFENKGKHRKRIEITLS